MADVWRPLKTGTELEEAARNTLRLWFPTYLREIELQRELGTDVLPLPKSWLIAEEIESEQGDALPAVVLVSPGITTQNPSQDGEGNIRAWWYLGVAVIVAAGNSPDVKRLVRLYAAVVRSIMLQKQSLGGFANGVSWIDESYDDSFPFADRVTTSAGMVVFHVEVGDVVNRFAGPPTPDTPPGYEWGTVQSTEVIVEKE